MRYKTALTDARYSWFPAALAIILSAAGSTLGSTTTLVPTIDANLRGHYPDPAEVLAATSGLLVELPVPNETANLDFGLNNLPANATLDSVSLNIYEISAMNGEQYDMVVMGYPRSGEFTSADFIPAGAFSGVGFTTTMVPGEMTIPCSAYFIGKMQALIGGSNDLGIQLSSDESGLSASFASIEQSSSFPPPSLTVTYTVPVPEPEITALCAWCFLLHTVIQSRRYRV